jgi:hypothetical protein
MGLVGRAGLTANGCSSFLATAVRRHLLRAQALPILLLNGAFSHQLLAFGSGSCQDTGVFWIFPVVVQ